MGRHFEVSLLYVKTVICGKKVIDTAADLWYHISVAKAAGAESRRGLGLLRLV